MNTHCDRYGQDIIGEDEHGRWFGTEDQPITLPENIEAPKPRRLYRWRVDGYWLADPYVAFVRAPSRQRVEDFFHGIRIREFTIEKVRRPVW